MARPLRRAALSTLAHRLLGGPGGQPGACLGLNRALHGSSPSPTPPPPQLAESTVSSPQPPPAPSSDELISMEDRFGAHNYHPLPVVFARAQGAQVWDPEGRHYIDCLSAYSAVNQGHAHPRIIQALEDQAHRCTLTSRAFYNDKFPEFARFITSLFEYDRMLPMNTGAEAVESGLKLAKKWAYEKKGVSRDQALIVSCCGCFHGRTMAAISMSCDNDATRGFGPLLPGQLKVDFADLEGLEKIFQEHGPRIAGFILEPIQGEAGVVVPFPGYLKAVRELCTKHNILMIADEVQTGLGRTGHRLACDFESVKPDLVLLGKALGGGVLPVSAVLGNDDVMLTLRPGQHGSTFGGNPLASAVAIASLEVLEEEHLAENARRLGVQLQEQLQDVWQRFPGQIKEVRGRGLLVAVELDPQGLGPASAIDVCLAMKERGILAKPTQSTTIRFAPPLCISDDDVAKISSVLEAVLDRDLPRLQVEAAAAKGGAGARAQPEPCDRCGRVRRE